ncbi:DUF4230 domain-containing protein [Actinoplanes sp. N902-109]|uniref:DUF4230 domain-containing protein n=1 Tax=Actinoplanes sp. (strain N902-109) TaxID=649831 RepID=UPI00032959D9|nr:DUF4230 domain-containing protein [Actinoplanes sp. N902-109]AGL14041.1 secreted protein [Actinoplanes sp. N902-109]
MAESHTPKVVDDPTSEYPEVEAPPPTPAADPEQPRRVGGFARVLIFFGVVFALIVAMCFGLRALNVLPSFDNPFSDKTTDRSQPVLLQSMRDLSRYVAADGNFQVIVDLQENKDNVPDFLINDRTLFVGAGTVEEYVDFSKLSTDALSVDEGNNKITIKLPAPEQGQAALDMNRSYVVAEERGLFNRIGDAFKSDPNQQQRVYQLAQQRITEAARSSGLDQRAQQNTEKMLQSLFARLGYTTVTVQFTNP